MGHVLDCPFTHYLLATDQNHSTFRSVVCYALFTSHAYMQGMGYLIDLHSVGSTWYILAFGAWDGLGTRCGI
jgi:hypothetical protein